jgi:hypothetical protein
MKSGSATSSAKCSTNARATANSGVRLRKRVKPNEGVKLRKRASSAPPLRSTPTHTSTSKLPQDLEDALLAVLMYFPQQQTRYLASELLFGSEPMEASTLAGIVRTIERFDTELLNEVDVNLHTLKALTVLKQHAGLTTKKPSAGVRKKSSGGVRKKSRMSIRERMRKAGGC